MALYDGKMKKYGDVQLGIQTGDARKFKSWDEFWNAYVQQHMLLLRTTFISSTLLSRPAPSTSPSPWAPCCTLSAASTASTCISPRSPKA